MCQQRTISQSIKTTGIGLHSGKKVNITLLPHHENGGIVFRRTDLESVVDIPADAMLVGDTMMCSNLKSNGVKVGTVEHLMSAVAGLGIDNLVIEVSGAEVPIMDGSAAPFVSLILSAGIEKQPALKRFFQVKQTVQVQLEDKVASLTPHMGFTIDFTIDFNHPAFKECAQYAQLEFGSESFMALSRARTFGFLRDIEKLRQNDLALGGSMDNAIVVDDEKVLNEGGLRYSDEFVRHKILDAIGDLYLAGMPILGHFKAYKSGHHLNNLLVRKLLSDPSNYDVVTFERESDCPIDYLTPIQVAEAS